MKNLFIMHTQYNLIIACGLALTKYKNDDNDLILHAEFRLNELMHENLEHIFGKVTVVQSQYYKHRNFILDEVHIHGLMSEAREYFGKNYDAILVSEENYWDTLLLSRLNTRKIINIEEDIYFSVLPVDITKKKLLTVIKEKLRKVIRRCEFGKNKYFDVSNPSFYGENDMYSSYYALFPDAVRERVLQKQKEIMEINRDMLTEGINGLYQGIDLSFPKGNYAVLFVDLIERYPDREKAEREIQTVIELCLQNEYRVLLKYHPRETNKVKVVDAAVKEVDSAIPAEKVMTSLIGNRVLVIGNASASLNSSVKLGFTVISLMTLLEIRNESAETFYKKIGVHIPKDRREIDELLKNEDIF